MASFRERKNKVHVIIRKKGQSLGASFSNMEDAQLWAKYKEDIIDQIESFSPPSSEMVTLIDALDMKIDEMKAEGKHQKSILDYETLKPLLKDASNKSIQELDLDFYKNLLSQWESKVVYRGGSVKQKDRKGKPPALKTLIRRFAALSATYQFLKKKEIDLENQPQKITTLLRQKEKSNVF